MVVLCLLVELHRKGSALQPACLMSNKDDCRAASASPGNNWWQDNRFTIIVKSDFNQELLIQCSVQVFNSYQPSWLRKGGN